LVIFAAAKSPAWTALIPHLLEGGDGAIDGNGFIRVQPGTLEKRTRAVVKLTSFDHAVAISIETTDKIGWIHPAKSATKTSPTKAPAPESATAETSSAKATSAHSPHSVTVTASEPTAESAPAASASEARPFFRFVPLCQPPAPSRPTNSTPWGIAGGRILSESVLRRSSRYSHRQHG
jgi:hypothetical protein